MDDLKGMISEAADFIRARIDLVPQIGLILGTGLGSLGEGIELIATVDYGSIPHFPVSTVESHQGRLLFGHLRSRPVVAMQGRFHYYEGYTMKQVTFPVRVMKELGIEMLIVSNACGGLNPQFERGDIVIITDHINFQAGNPLIGRNDDTLGDRFPDMYNCYDKDLRKLAEETALELKIPIRKGVYVSVAGPNLETAAEYRFFRAIGADVVGMSTVPEVIAARHQKTKVLAFSIITDMGLPDALGPCSLDEIIATAKKAEPMLRDLIAACVGKM
ncbi:MAG: purine-nucleoside phosphorylase [Candidatus Zixiibacteriota bacterium]|nr:MAG: purine-nucleoside phosphorylase [candidate division Zixibacteria bacterium]